MRAADRWPRVGSAALIGVVAAIALLLGIAAHPLAVDDAFVTYRYAQRLASGLGFEYNPGRPVLSTTAPLYALLLAAGALAWPDLPALANTLSSVAVGVAALLLFLLGRQEGTPWAGALAALFLVGHPLLWLSLGLETALFLALALAGLLAYRSGRVGAAAALLALATLTRGDAVLLVGILAVDHVGQWLGRRRAFPPLEARSAWLRSTAIAAGLYLAVLLPLWAWLAWQFGSPLPATLRAKVSQAELGVTGFYAHTTYLEGAWILLRARLSQSLLYLLFVPAVCAGLAIGLRRARWAALLAAWGAAHFLGYLLLGVTPYYWYYVPLLPGLAATAALGAVAGGRWLAGRWGRPGQAVIRAGVTGLWVAALLVALGRSDGALLRALDGPVPPPEDPLSKVLPEAKGGVYELAGRWLYKNTPPDALVGVTEVGILGYYAGRPMVDFLGLLEPEVAEALERGDLYWALLRYQPDYLALTAIAPLYAYDLRADPWFQAAYAPVQTFADPRFWGSPLVVYRRQVPRTPVVGLAGEGEAEGWLPLGVDFGPIRLVGASTTAQDACPGDTLALTLFWEATGPVTQDYTVFVHLLGQHERVIAQRDAPPGLGARATSGWSHGQRVVDPYLLAVPEAAYAPDQAVWEVGLYDSRTGRRLQAAGSGDQIRFGRVAIRPAARPLRLNFGQLALTGYDLDRLALSQNELLQVALQWAAPTGDMEPVTVTVQLVGEAGNVAVQASHRLGLPLEDPDGYALTLGSAAPPGAYDLEVMVSDATAGRALPLLGADGQPRGDRARLTKVRLYP